MWGSTAFLIAGRLWSSACTLATLYVLARHLNTGEFGRFTFYLALFMVLDSFVDLGTGQVAVQWTAAQPERTRAVLSAARRVRVATGLLGFLAVFALAWLFDEPGIQWLLLAALYPVTHALELTTTALKNHIAWARPVAVRSVASGFSLLFVLLVLQRGAHSPSLYLLAVAAGSALGNVGLHWTSRAFLPPAGQAAASISGEPHRVESPLTLLRAALPIGLAGLCQQTYFWVDNLFVRPLCGSEALGQYNLAVRLMSFGIMMGVYAAMASLPWLTRQQQAQQLGPAVARLAMAMAFLGALGTGLVWPHCHALLSLFGTEGGFTPAVPALRWLLLATLCVHAGAPLLTAIIAAGHARTVLRIAATGLALNLLGNALLVRPLGIEGAAITTLCTEAWVVFGSAHALVRAGASPVLQNRRWYWLCVPIGFAGGGLLSNLIGSWLPH